ncbi:hypothetical protein WHR41_05371 [Cladosporium halotolerans]|uniref:NADH-ubiquinone oxidoreductase 9.5 kDa subunit n=1 Tax=Cladosporium halotolerans TaxID=1052096 RepID=A0AB34KR37_9PEZI
MAPVTFWAAPRQYITWAARNKPAILWSLAIGSCGPLIVAVVPALRERFGDPNRQQIPLTYPVPKGPRQIPQGYDD